MISSIKIDGDPYNSENALVGDCFIFHVSIFMISKEATY